MQLRIGRVWCYLTHARFTPPVLSFHYYNIRQERGSVGAPMLLVYHRRSTLHRSNLLCLSKVQGQITLSVVCKLAIPPPVILDWKHFGTGSIVLFCVYVTPSTVGSWSLTRASMQYNNTNIIIVWKIVLLPGLLYHKICFTVLLRHNGKLLLICEKYLSYGISHHATWLAGQRMQQKPIGFHILERQAHTCFPPSCALLHTHNSTITITQQLLLDSCWKSLVNKVTV